MPADENCGRNYCLKIWVSDLVGAAVDAIKLQV